MKPGSDHTRNAKCRNGLHWMTEANSLLVRQPSTGGVYVRCRACKRNARRQADIDPGTRQRSVAAAKGRGLPAGDPRHGTPNGYTYYGCRCEACTEAIRVANHVARLKAQARRLGITIPKEVNVIPDQSSIYSLEAITAARGDHSLLGQSIWDDPVADEALAAL